MSSQAELYRARAALRQAIQMFDVEYDPAGYDEISGAAVTMRDAATQLLVQTASRLDPDQLLRDLLSAVTDIRGLSRPDHGEPAEDVRNLVLDLDAAMRAGCPLPVAWLSASGSREDTCRPDDPDPTPHGLSLAELCGNVDDDCMCTRRPDHRGRQHVAGNGEIVLHVWPSREA
jgi:hypothetical protein